VYRPKAASDARPVVIYNRGSFVRQNAARELLVPFHRRADATDLMNIETVIASLPYADAISRGIVVFCLLDDYCIPHGRSPSR
jgi:hypothetical protein